MLGKDIDTHEGHDHHDHENIPSVGFKEFKALKRARYNEVAPRFNKVFVLRKVKTEQVVELRAASSYHACKMIGWKPNDVRLVEEKEFKPEKNKSETASDDSKETTKTKE